MEAGAAPKVVRYLVTNCSSALGEGAAYQLPTRLDSRASCGSSAHSPVPSSLTLSRDAPWNDRVGAMARSITPPCAIKTASAPLLTTASLGAATSPASVLKCSTSTTVPCAKVTASLKAEPATSP